MSDLKAAHELERLRYTHRIEELNEEERNRVQQINADAAARGIYQSGWRGAAIAKTRVDKMRALIDARVSIRKELLADVPDLGSEHELDFLAQELSTTIQHAFTGLADSLAREMATSGTVGPNFHDETVQLQARVRLQIEMLKSEIKLNFHNRPKSGPAVSVTTGGGPAIVNLGNIYGNVQQVIGNVGEQGQTELAASLRRLADAINASEQLGESRTEFLEQVRFIAEQATVEPEKRQLSVIKGVLTGLRASVQHIAEIASILSLTGPAIAHYFNFPWPF